MNDKTKIVMNGFLNLSLAEKTELVKNIGEFFQSKDDHKIKLNEDISITVKRVLGPLSQLNCTCCGK
jgi:hypothetical protein